MSPWIEALGWTLIHFVWQGTLVAAAASAALRLCRRSPGCRYAVACLALVAMLASAASTAVVLYPGSMLPPGRTVGPALVGQEATPRTERIEGLVVPTDSRTAAVRVTVDRALPVIVWLWLAGVTVLLARFSGGCWRVHRLRTGSLEQAASRWQVRSEQLADRLGVDVAFRVVESSLVKAPTVIGWLRPLILLPVSALACMPADQIEALIAHELAHIRRRDYAVNLLQTIAEALLFFHPAVWWISSRIRQEREHCCDDAAVAVWGEPSGYAEALAALASLTVRTAALSVGAADGSLVARIRRLVDVPEDDRPPALGAIVAVAFGVAFAVTLLAFQTPPASAQAAATSPGATTRSVRRTDHFEIQYAAALDLHAERVAVEAERAYERVSGDLRHSLASTVTIVLVASAAEMEQARHETVTQTSEHRLLLPADRPADQWFGLLTHEVTHIFSFDIIPGARTPEWIMEGLAEYERGAWDPADLVKLREAVRTGAVPALMALPPAGTTAAPPIVQTVGHAAFDFIETRWGKAGIRQFLFALRQAALGGSDPYQAAFQLGEAAFSQEFQRYLPARFRAPAAQAQRFDRASSRRIEGELIGLIYPVSPGLACLELLVPDANDDGDRWGIECGDAPAADLIAALQPGQRVIVVGAPARDPEARRLAIDHLARPLDGYTWQRPHP